jgi:hypothetical protein
VTLKYGSHMGPDALELLRPELPVIVLETLGLTILGHKLHRPAEQVADHGHVIVPLAEGLLVDAKIARGIGLLPGLSPPDGSGKVLNWQISR